MENTFYYEDIVAECILSEPTGYMFFERVTEGVGSTIWEKLKKLFKMTLEFIKKIARLLKNTLIYGVVRAVKLEKKVIIDAPFKYNLVEDVATQMESWGDELKKHMGLIGGSADEAKEGVDNLMNIHREMEDAYLNAGKDAKDEVRLNDVFKYFMSRKTLNMKLDATTSKYGKMIEATDTKVMNIQRQFTGKDIPRNIDSLCRLLVKITSSMNRLLNGAINTYLKCTKLLVTEKVAKYT